MLPMFVILSHQNEDLAEARFILPTSDSITDESPADGDRASTSSMARLVSPTPTPKRFEGGASAQELWICTDHILSPQLAIRRCMQHTATPPNSGYNLSAAEDSFGA